MTLVMIFIFGLGLLSGMVLISFVYLITPQHTENVCKLSCREHGYSGKICSQLFDAGYTKL
jgi:hypothetical protein